MGNVFALGVSSTKQDVVNEIIQEQRQKAGNVSCQNTTGDTKFVYVKSTARNILITQECRARLQQIYNGLQKKLAELVQDAEAVAKSGGILSAELSFAVSKAKTLLKQNQIQECGNINVNNIRGDITVDATESNIYNFQFSQAGDAEQICAFEATADLIAKIENLTKAETKGGGMKLFEIAIVAIGVLIVLGVVVNFLRDDKSKVDENQKGGAGGGGGIILLILALLIVVICGCN